MRCGRGLFSRTGKLLFLSPRTLRSSRCFQELLDSFEADFQFVRIRTESQLSAQSLKVEYLSMHHRGLCHNAAQAVEEWYYFKVMSPTHNAFAFTGKCTYRPTDLTVEGIQHLKSRFLIFLWCINVTWSERLFTLVSSCSSSLHICILFNCWPRWDHKPGGTRILDNQPCKLDVLDCLFSFAFCWKNADAMIDVLMSLWRLWTVSLYNVDSLNLWTNSCIFTQTADVERH